MAYEVQNPKFTVNRFKEVIVAFGAIAGSLTTLKDLSGQTHYNHMSIRSSLNQKVEIQLPLSADPVTINASETVVYDCLQVNGIVQIKAPGTLPASGEIRVQWW